VGCAPTLPRYRGNSKRFAVLTVSTVCRQRNDRPGHTMPLHLGGIRSAIDAVRAAIVAEQRAKG